VWHGAQDKSVPVEAARAMVSALQAAGGQPSYTEVPDGGHNVWDKAYGDRELWKWLLEQKLPD
jgi:predicted peptidase